MADQNKKEWWRGAVIYQVYPRSFKDTSGNGTGDLPGITEKLDYIAALGVDAIWISPFFKSPMKDFGYDVSDYCAVDPLFGQTEDFKKLLDKAHSLGIKVIADFVLTHSSDQHPWFTESRSSQNNDKADWYIWADPKPDGSPPNNWQAHFGGPAWIYDVRRGQYYFHNFLPEQPDINLRNPDAKKALFDAMRFWLDMGVDGFRLDAARHYFCDPSLKDNPPNPNPSSVWFDHPTPFSMQKHVNDVHIPDTIAFMEEVRALLDQYEDRMAVAEIGGEDPLMYAAQYTDGPQRIHTAYTFSLTSGDKASAAKIRGAVEEFQKQPGKGWASWAFSTHDVIRTASRWHPDKNGWNHDPRLSRTLLAALASLRGTIFVYQGEELGLPESTIPYEKIQDPMGKYLYPAWQGRDGCRTPMPWDSTQKNLGFGDASEPWLPVAPEHKALAADIQEKDSASTLHFMRNFLKWRKTQPALVNGDITFHDTGDDEVLMFSRSDNSGKLLCVFNLSASEKKMAVPGTPDTKAAFDAKTQSAQLDGKTLVLPPFGLYCGPLS